jgi:hypothetical protein
VGGRRKWKAGAGWKREERRQREGKRKRERMVGYPAVEERVRGQRNRKEGEKTGKR